MNTTTHNFTCTTIRAFDAASNFSPTTMRAIRKYGMGECLNSYTLSQQGYTTETVARLRESSTPAARAAIAAGREVIQTWDAVWNSIK